MCDCGDNERSFYAIHTYNFPGVLRRTTEFGHGNQPSKVNFYGSMVMLNNRTTERFQSKLTNVDYDAQPTEGIRAI